MGYVKYFMPETQRSDREMKQKYIGVYKCRLCGESFSYGKAYSANRSIARVAMANAIPILFQNKTSGMVHCCKDGSIGICDLQGFKEVGE